MRLFVAIPLKKNLQQALMAVMRDLNRLGFRGNFSSLENLHLTLAFIGDYPDHQAVVKALASVNSPAPNLVTQGLGHFGDLVWLGLEDSLPLQQVAKAVRTSLQANDIPFDPKHFKPHITVARRVNIGHLQDQPFPVPPSQRMTATQFSLMSSELRDGRLIYREIASFSLDTK